MPMPEAISTEDIRNEADQSAAQTMRNATSNDDIQRLKAHCARFIAGLSANHATQQARSKLDEMIFWLQAAIRRDWNDTL